MPVTRDKNGTLPHYAWPGGYSIVYLMADSETICADCANQKNGSLASEKSDDKQWKIVDGYIHWEGDSIQCAHCNKVLESEYGPVEDNPAPVQHE